MENGFITDNDKLYYCSSDGEAVVFNGPGADGWQRLEGTWFYFEKGRPLKYTSKKLGTAYYLFDSFGRMCENGLFYNGCTDTSNKPIYSFAGKNGALAVNTWKHIGSDWYYFNKTGKSVNNVKIIKGVNYSFVNGRLATCAAGSNFDAIFYYSDSDGMVDYDAFTEDGWHKLDGFWFYSVSGKAVINRSMIINGAAYSFDKYGRMK